MTNIFDVAKCILTKRGKMSTIKLQFLCYYSQMWHLKFEGKPLFDEDFEAWEIGPVCRILYDLCKGKFPICADDIPSDRLSGEKLCFAALCDVDVVLDYYGDHDMQWLSELVRTEKPWVEAREKDFLERKHGFIISKDSIKSSVRSDSGNA